MGIPMKLSVSSTPWDDKILHKKTGRITLKNTLTKSDLDSLIQLCSNYDLVVIDSSNSTKRNNYLLSELPNCFLCNTLITLNKGIPFSIKTPAFNSATEQIIITNNYPYCKELLDMNPSLYRYSRFYEDERISKKYADQVYKKWCEDAFEQSDKYFATYYKDETLVAYLLFSIKDNLLITELQATSPEYQGLGIGQRLLLQVELYGLEQGITTFQTGTQSANLSMLHLYEKNGYRIHKIHTIFHYWPPK